MNTAPSPADDADQLLPRVQAAHAEAEAAAQRFRALVQHTSDIILVVDPDCIVRYITPSVLRVLGFRPEELVGAEAMPWVHPDDRDAFRAHLLQYADQPGSRSAVQVRALHRNGSWRWLEAVATDLRHERSVGGLVINARDITERKQMEEDLRLQTTLLEAQTEASLDGILVVDSAGQILSCNRRFVEMWGIPAEVMTTRSDHAALRSVVDQLVNPQAFLERIAYLYAHPDEHSQEEIRLKDGRTFDRYSTPVRGADGASYGRVWFFRDISARKQAADALRQSEERFRALVQHASDIIVVLDAEGTMRYVSPPVERLLGYQPEELVGTNPFPLIHPDDYPRVDAAFDRVGVQPGFHEPMEFRLRHADGTWRYLEGRANNLLHDPVVGGIVVNVRDITERKRVEEAQRFLAEASEVLASSLDYETTLASVARLAVPRLADWCTVDIVEREAHVRRVATAHVDQAKEELVNYLQQRYPFHLTAPPTVREALRAGRPQIYRDISAPMLVAFARDSEHLDILRQLGPRSLMIVPLVARGQMLGAIGFITAESGRQYGLVDLAVAEELARRAALAVDNARLYREAQEARRTAERTAERTARLQAVTARLSEATTPAQVAEVVMAQVLPAVGAYAGGILRLSRDGAELEILRAFGYPEAVAEAWRRYPLGMPIPPADAAQMGEPLWIESVAGRADRYPALAEVATVTGTHALAAIPLILEGRVTGVMNLSFAAERTFSGEDRAFMVALAQQCAQALERARLYEAERTARTQAEQALHVREEFLTSISHDLRTPLTSIKGFAQILAGRLTRADIPQRDVVVEGLTGIDTAATKMTALVLQLLDLARLEADQPLELERERTDLVALVRQVVDGQQPRLTHHHMQVQAPVPELVGRWDALRLERVVGNLLSNAIKYSPAGGDITVTIAPEEQEEGEDGARQWAVLTVRDPGVGIPAHDLPHIFERFHRGANVGRIAGTGIGLAAVKQIVEQHGGTINVASEEGVGTTVSVRLPLD